MKQRRARTMPALASLLILALAAAAGCTTVTNASGRIELSATEFNFGTIPNTGPVSQTFQVRNGGQRWLEITGVSTSCGCTTAEVGSRRLAPGEATDLRVTFDPQTHDGAMGAFLRQVYVRSNDPDTPEASLTIRATVVEPGKRPDEPTAREGIRGKCASWMGRPRGSLQRGWGTALNLSMQRVNAR